MKTAAERIESPTHRPTIPGSVAAIATSLVAIGLLIDTAAQWQALLVEVAGLALVSGGYAAWQRRDRVGGPLLSLAGVLPGVALVVTGLVLSFTLPTAIIHRLELIPGMLGLGLLLAGLLPVRSGWERAFLATGATLLFVGVVTSGVVRSSSLSHLLVAGIATVVAWNLGDQAISLGRQVGRQARTYRLELVHAGGSVLVGTGVFAAVVVLSRLDVHGLPLSGFAILLIGAFVLVLALR